MHTSHSWIISSFEEKQNKRSGQIIFELTLINENNQKQIYGRIELTWINGNKLNQMYGRIKTTIKVTTDEQR